MLQVDAPDIDAPDIDTRDIDTPGNVPAGWLTI